MRRRRARPRLARAGRDPASAAAATPPASPPAAAAPAQTSEETQQDLEARLIQLQRELDGLQKQRAAWEDMRRTLDELGPRVDELSRRVEQPPAQSRPSPLRNPSESSRFFRNGDGSSWLRPEVRLQAGYAGTLVQEGPGQKSPPDTSTFLIQHAELQFEGNLLQRRFEYRLLFDFVDPQYLKDAFVQWRHGSWIAVRVGQYKLPFGFQRYLRSTYYDFVDLSETMTAFSLERDIGVMVLGRPLGGRLQYQLAVTNGAGAGKLNENRDLAYTARVVAAPWGRAARLGRRPRRTAAAAGVDRRRRLLQPDADRRASRAPATRRRTPTSTTTGASTTSRSGRAASSCACTFAARRCRPSCSAASNIREPTWPTGPSGASTCRPATS